MTAAITANEEQTRGLDTLLGPYWALRGNRDLALLFGGQVVSAMGDWLYVTALVALVYSVTGSAAVAGALTFMRLLPYAILSPFAGLLADRFDRRILMVIADAGRAVCMLGLLAVHSRGTVWLAFPLVFATTCFGSLFRPALGALLPAVAGDDVRLVRVNALMSQVDGVALVLGPALGGLLLTLGHAQFAFALNAATYAVSGITLSLLRAPCRPQADAVAEDDRLAGILAGVRFLLHARNGALAAMTATMAALAAVNGAYWTLLVVLAVETWHIGGQGSGFLFAAYGVGGLAGGFLAAGVARRLSSVAAYGYSLAFGAVAVVLLGFCPLGPLPFVLLGFCPLGPLPFVLLAAFGVGDVVNGVVGTTLLQRATPDALLGRVFGAFEATVVGAALLGALATGPLIGAIGPRAVTVALGLSVLVILLVALPRLRGLDGREQTLSPDSAVPAPA